MRTCLLRTRALLQSRSTPQLRETSQSRGPIIVVDLWAKAMGRSNLFTLLKSTPPPRRSRKVPLKRRQPRQARHSTSILHPKSCLALLPEALLQLLGSTGPRAPRASTTRVKVLLDWRVASTSHASGQVCLPSRRSRRCRRRQMP